MKRIGITSLCALLIFAASCAEGEPKQLSFQEQMELDSQESENKAKELELENTGIGPIDSYELSETVNTQLAEQGKALFQEKCTACHKENEKVLGPPPSGIVTRRNPAWILNMILNPEEMIQKDPIAKKLLEEYKTPMLNQNLSQEEAKAVLEYFRTI
jgi:mono/diheme cytochrome c family protein